MTFWPNTIFKYIKYDYFKWPCFGFIELCEMKKKLVDRWEIGFFWLIFLMKFIVWFELWIIKLFDELKIESIESL